MDQDWSRSHLAAWTMGTALILAACSGSEETDANVAAQAKEFSDLFVDGFDKSRTESSRAAEIFTDAMLTYRVDPKIRRAVADMLADNLNRNFSMRFRMEDPERFLRSGAAADVGNRMIEALGLPGDTVAGATVLMFGLGWELANDRALTPDDQKALLSQAASLLGEHEVSGRGDAARQREGDTRLLTAALWLEETRLRRTDPQAMRELSDAVHRDMQRITDNDMRAHGINADGFVDR